MLGLSYLTTLTYFYDDKEELKNIHLLENIKDAKFFEQEMVVQYVFNRNQFILLQDLLFKISINYIRFHLGQLLVLFQKLLEKAKTIRAQNMDHKYLDLNRVWLRLEPGSSQLGITYQKISYSIVFTGYQCPLYENGFQEEQNVDKSTLQIISTIIDMLKNSIILKQPDEKFQTLINNEIYELIKNTCLTNNIDNTQSLIDKLLNKYNYNEETQIISVDDNVDYDQITLFGIQKYGRKNPRAVMDDLRLILEHFRFGNQLFLELALNQAMLLQVKKIESLYYSKIKFDYEMIHQITEQQRQNTRKQISQQLSKAIQDQTNYEVKKIQNQFKLDITEQEKQQINDEILKKIMQFKLFEYFDNSLYIHQHLNTKDNIMAVMSITQILHLVNEQWNFYLQLQILSFLETLV